MELHTLRVADPAVVLASVASAILAAFLLVAFGRPKVRFSSVAVRARQIG
jgi:hypothetical protein